jgi:hypothetical protein
MTKKDFLRGEGGTGPGELLRLPSAERNPLVQGSGLRARFTVCVCVCNDAEMDAMTEMRPTGGSAVSRSDDDTVPLSSSSDTLAQTFVVFAVDLEFYE